MTRLNSLPMQRGHAFMGSVSVHMDLAPCALRSQMGPGPMDEAVNLRRASTCPDANRRPMTP
jgi:hypothetical protein